MQNPVSSRHAERFAHSLTPEQAEIELQSCGESPLPEEYIDSIFDSVIDKAPPRNLPPAGYRCVRAVVQLSILLLGLLGAVKFVTVFHALELKQVHNVNHHQNPAPTQLGTGAPLTAGGASTLR